MQYFSNFDLISYDFTIKSDKAPIIETFVDLTERAQLFVTDADMLLLCDQYLIPSGMKPEQVAGLLYNDPFLHWTIFYANNITSLSDGWPLSENALSSYVTKRYGSGKENDNHHYEKLPEGVQINPDFCLSVYGVQATEITNYDYEYRLNDMKRRIQVIKPTQIAAFVQTFNAATVPPSRVL